VMDICVAANPICSGENPAKHHSRRREITYDSS
jgi:hypothetical protein